MAATTQKEAGKMVRKMAQEAGIERVFHGVGNSVSEPYVQMTFSPTSCWVTIAPEGDRNRNSQRFLRIAVG